MESFGTIRQISVDNPLVFTFRIDGEVRPDDMKGMSETMNAAFDLHPSVSMLLIFNHYEGTEARAEFDMKVLKSQFRALLKVDKYAVVGALKAAAAMIKVMGKIIPTDARAFEAADEPAAWLFVGASPSPRSST